LIRSPNSDPGGSSLSTIQAGEQLTPRRSVAGQLSAVDRFLPAVILLAMAVGLGLGRVWPGLGPVIARWQIQDVSVPIAIGLLLMMYPILARVRYERAAQAAQDWRMLGASLVMNWLVGPAFMFALAWLLLPDQPGLRTGVILVGLARCIAMVLVWNQLASGDAEYAAVLVALNAIFQIVAYAGLAAFYLNVLPGWLGLQGQSIAVNAGTVAASVAIFLGVPLVAGVVTQLVLVRRKGRAWYEANFVRRTNRLTLIGLLFTIVVMFALQGQTITSMPLTVARVMLPLLGYFAGMFLVAFFGAWALRFSYEKATTLGFTAASNDFELAIAVAVTVFGVQSAQALGAVIGPLVEVPVLLALVYVALWTQHRLFAEPGARADAAA
jgi:ACR3 family arsenite transporter